MNQALAITADMEILPPFSKEEEEQALKAKTFVEELLDAIARKQQGLESNFVELGRWLQEIHSHQWWILWGFKSFSSYLISLEPRVKKGRTQLYNAWGIAKDLLPYVPAKELAEIGITNAATLRTLVKDGKRPTPELIEAAKHVTTEQLEAQIAEESGLRIEHEKGKWRSFGGAFMTSEDWALFIRACNVAAMTDPALGHTIGKWSDVSPAIKKEIILHRFCAEYLATYEAQVAQGQA